MNLRFTARYFPISLVATALAVAAAQAQERQVPDTFLAVTTNMTPADVELKADILRWSSDEDRRAVITALQDEEDPSAALSDLPSLGVVWRSGSAVGSAIKYAHRTKTDNGREVVTLLTDRTIGSTSFNPWVANQSATDEVLDYSVVELTLEEGVSGFGTMSLAAEVLVDIETSTIGLDPKGTEPLLRDVRMAPKPYWATP